MILTIKTDSPMLQLALFDVDSTSALHEKQVELGRSMARDILKQIETLLYEANTSWTELAGVVVFSGPGSFTGLRIGATIANTIAYAESLPVIGAGGEAWQNQGLKRLKNGENDQMVMPEYGKPANITLPRK